MESEDVVVHGSSFAVRAGAANSNAYGAEMGTQHESSVREG